MEELASELYEPAVEEFDAEDEQDDDVASDSDDSDGQ